MWSVFAHVIYKKSTLHLDDAVSHMSFMLRNLPLVSRDVVCLYPHTWWSTLYETTCFLLCEIKIGTHAILLKSFSFMEVNIMSNMHFIASFLFRIVHNNFGHRWFTYERKLFWPYKMKMHCSLCGNWCLKMCSFRLWAKYSFWFWL